MIEVLWVTQVDADGVGSHEITMMEVKLGMWGRIGNMPILLQRETLLPGDVLIDLMDEAGVTILNDSPYVISTEKAQWLLGEFFHAPAVVMAKIELVNEQA